MARRDEDVRVLESEPVTLVIERMVTAEARVAELEQENALLKRALAMLTRSLEDAEVPR